MMRCSSSPTVMVLVLCLVAGTGCGGAVKPKDHVPVYPTSGVVTYKNKPVEGAIVQFLNIERGKPGATGVTNSKGEYNLTTYEGADGAAVGSYIVLISKPEKPASAPPSGGVESDSYVPPLEDKNTNPDAPPPQPKNLLPAKYLNAARTELKADVRSSGTNQFPFDLKD